MEDQLKLGVITSTHGLKGEVKVFPFTDLDRFEELESLLLDTGREMLELEVEGVRYHKNQVIMKFAGFDDINDIEKYKGKELWIRREDAQELGEDEYYIGDLIGMEVVCEDGSYLGKLTDVLETGANDVYEVTLEDGKKVLLPAIKECILDVAVEENRMTIHLMKGLLA